MTGVPDVKLNDGNVIPQLGFGVWQVPDDEAVRAVSTAFQVGYRSIDTAALYHNERGVGRAIADSGLARNDLYITTKLWNDRHEHAEAAFEESLGKLGLDHLDLYLIHWPSPAQGNYRQAWKSLVQLQKDGRVRSIGVSNFGVDNLQRIIDDTGVVPAVNQVELHPNLPQSTLRAFHAEHGIATEAWSPLAQGNLIGDPAVAAIAAKRGRSPAQVIIRWHLQLGNVVIPKSVTPSRIAENFDVFGFELDEQDLARITALDNNGRVGPNPASARF